VNVGFDTSPLAQTRAGTARYITNLLRQLEVDVRRFAFGGAGRAATVVRETLWYPVLLPRVAARARVDVLHCPTYRAPLRSTVPLVVTVHDVAAFRHPETFNRWTRTVVPLLVPRVLAAARLVIAVSEFTRRELVELLRVPEAKIRVVPNAVDTPFAADGAAADGDYVLAVGTLEPRKNLVRVVEAARRAQVELRVVGARGWGDVAVHGNGVCWLGEVSDDELARLYRGARAVAYPSLYEGFGIPILEAMACGAPVVTSAGGATEEVAGGAAVLVDPRDSTAIAAGLDEAAQRRDELRQRGLERARAFSWAAVARATEAVYREASA
jgi:glycosyltransferase involved in cell wall biosynthesis